MFILGLQGSPRKNGNTDYLLSAFMQEANKYGASTQIINVADKKINPCIECGYCEEKGYCFISDEMNSEIYYLLKKADIIIAATPIFFYSFPSQFKALIDRSQALWARKYKLKLKDTKAKFRKGFFLGVGATKGKNLFNGIKLTAKYFFDAVNAEFTGELCYSQIEKTNEIKKIPNLEDDIKKAVQNLLSPLIKREKILFVCSENACRSQIAKAYAEYFAGDKTEALSAGSNPADKVNEIMIEVMAEDQIDMSFIKPVSIEKSISETKPDIIVTMGCEEKCPAISNTKTIEWNLSDPKNQPIKFMRNIRDEIKDKVTLLLNINE